MRSGSLFYRLMSPDADGTGSSGAVDRGDDFVPAPDPAPAPAPEPDPAPAPDAPAPDAPAPDAPAPDAPAPDAPAPRDDTGKFTKKEKGEDGPLIPKARFDEQLGKERTAREAAERRASDLETQIKRNSRSLDIEAAVAEVATLRKSERAALLDGDEEKAATLSAEADRLNRRISIAEAAELSTQDKSQALEDMRMDLTIERLEEKYPMLVAGSETYDQEVLDDVLDKQAGLMERERLSPSKALAKAAAQVMGRMPAPAPTDTPVDTTVDTPPAAGLKAAQEAAERKTAAVTKNLDASARQPGSTKDVGLASDKAGQTKTVPAASSMTLEEFSALPEATRASMRGDFA